MSLGLAWGFDHIDGDDDANDTGTRCPTLVYFPVRVLRSLVRHNLKIGWTAGWLAASLEIAIPVIPIDLVPTALALRKEIP